MIVLAFYVLPTKVSFCCIQLSVHNNVKRDKRVILSRLSSDFDSWRCYN